jgi:nitrite reductase/ring-hydroxylating ferredoxin subunit
MSVRTGSRFVIAAAASALPRGAALAVEVAGRRIALVNDGRMIHAVDGDCTHAAGPLGEGRLTAGCLLTCPWHGAVFDASSGAVMSGPARKPLRTYQVKVADGAIWVAVPAAETGGN